MPKQLLQAISPFLGVGALRLKEVAQKFNFPELVIDLSDGGALMPHLGHIAATCPLVRRLRVLGSFVGGPEQAAQLEQLRHLPGLRLLDALELLAWPTLTDDHLFQVSQLHNLASLSLYGCTAITDSGLAQLENLNLRSLMLGACHGLTDAAMAHLQPSLESVKLTLMNGLSDAALIGLSALPNLTELSLTKCLGLTPDGLALMSSSNLETLDAPGSLAITDASVLSLPPSLVNLNVSGCKSLTDEGLAHIAQCLPRLRTLDLTDCSQVTEAGMDQLAASNNGLTLKRAISLDQHIVSALANCLTGCDQDDVLRKYGAL